jgi:hypothetical protein
MIPVFLLGEGIWFPVCARDRHAPRRHESASMLLARTKANGAFPSVRISPAAIATSDWLVSPLTPPLWKGCYDLKVPMPGPPSYREANGCGEGDRQITSETTRHGQGPPRACLANTCHTIFGNWSSTFLAFVNWFGNSR